MKKNEGKFAVINHDDKKCSFIIALKASSFLIGKRRNIKRMERDVTLKVEVLKRLLFSHTAFSL